MRIDWWLAGLCLGRAMIQTVTMVYSAALPILLREWEMSAATAGAISSGYQIGYAVSLLIISTLADKIGLPFLLILVIGSIYSFTSLGDSPVLSVSLTEVVTPSYLGSAFGLRSLFGFGAGAVSPIVFGAILDWTNPHGLAQEYYSIWGCQDSGPYGR